MMTPIEAVAPTRATPFSMPLPPHPPYPPYPPLQPTRSLIHAPRGLLAVVLVRPLVRPLVGLLGWLLVSLLVSLLGCTTALAAPVPTGSWEPAPSAFQPPKYPPGFSHFGHVNPDAPKGGELRLGNPDRRSSVDKLNPFTIKGAAPAAMVMFVFETLATCSMDEPQAMCGLLAEAM